MPLQSFTQIFDFLKEHFKNTALSRSNEKKDSFVGEKIPKIDIKESAAKFKEVANKSKYKAGELASPQIQSVILARTRRDMIVRNQSRIDLYRFSRLQSLYCSEILSDTNVQITELER